MQMCIMAFKYLLAYVVALFIYCRLVPRLVFTCQSADAPVHELIANVRNSLPNDLVSVTFVSSFNKCLLQFGLSVKYLIDLLFVL